MQEDTDGRDGRVTMESAARGNISAERGGGGGGLREQTAEEEEEAAVGRRATSGAGGVTLGRHVPPSLFSFLCFSLMRSSAGRGCGSRREDTSLGSATAGQEDVLPAPLGSHG